MGNAIDKAVHAQGGAVVKPHQVKAMVLAARRAYMEQSKIGLVDDGVDFDTWRRAAIHDVVGAGAPSSFRAVTQRDYAAVIAYFEELAGDGRAKARRSDRTEDEQARALWALTLVEGEVAGALGGRDGARRYADALFAKIHNTSRVVASARQIWAVIFTLRNRAKARRGGNRPRRSAALPEGQTETRARKALGARGAAGVPSATPAPSERFPAFSRAL
jgi:hypothetical protein